MTYQSKYLRSINQPQQFCAEKATTLEAELVALVRKEIGAIASFRKAIVVQRLPKTR